MTADTRLALPTAAAWLFLAALIGFPGAVLPWAAAGCWGAAVLLLAMANFRARDRRVMLVLALCAVISGLFLTSAAAGSSMRRPAVVTEAADAGRSVTFVAVTAETVQGHESRFAVTAISVTVGDVHQDVSIPVLAFGTTGGPLGIGTELSLVGTLQATEQGDSVAYLLFLDDDPVVTRPPPWFLAWASDLRAGFLAQASALPGQGGSLLPGLAIGDTSAVGSELDAAMKTTSLSHLTAVSGANCAVIVALIMFGGAALGVPRRWRIAASVAVLVGFVVLVTPQPSVLRAAMMATLVLGAMAAGRPVRGLPVLSLAIVILLVADPWLARSYGFVLSVLATAGLLVLAGPIARALSTRIPRPLAVVIAVPLAAQLACQPVLVLLAPSIPTYGVIANILAEPAAPVATVLGLVACLILPWAPALGAGIAHLAWVPSAWIAAVAHFCAGLPLASLPWPGGATGLALALMVTLLGAVIALGGRWRTVAVIALIAVCVGYVGAAGGEQLRRRLAPPSDWQIAACDVGQGDAVLVRNGGKIMLIDTGPEPALLSYCLDTLGISRIDVLLLTHFDLDHVGGANAMIGRVDRLLQGPSSGAEDDRLVEAFADGGAVVEQVSRGRHGLLGDLRWRVLWPPARLGGIEPGNPASVALEFAGVGACAGGCLSSVFLGDLGEESQERLLALNRLPRVDVVKVSHHGSRDQSSRLYERLRATVGVIGVGVDNDYGHPTADLLKVLAASSTVIARTDDNGLSLVSMNDGVVQLWTERGGVAAPG